MAVNNARSLHGSSGEQDPLEFFLPDHDPEDDQEDDPEQDPGNAKQDQLIMTMEELIKKQKRQLYQDDANEKAQAQHEAKQRHKKEKEDKITLLLKEMKQLASIQEGRKKEVGMYNRSENWKKENQTKTFKTSMGQPTPGGRGRPPTMKTMKTEQTTMKHAMKQPEGNEERRRWRGSSRKKRWKTWG